MPTNIPLNSMVNILEQGRRVAGGRLIAVDNKTGEYGVVVPKRGLVRIKPDGKHQLALAPTNRGPGRVGTKGR